MRRAAYMLTLVALLASAAMAQDGRVRLNDNRLYVDGKPFFPYGCWGVIDSVETMRRHHFTCVFSGMGGTEELLAASEGTDFMVITYPYAPSWGPKHEEHVLAVRDHPNLLAWNIGDDLKGEDVEKVRQAYDFIRANDPHERPIMLDVIHGFEEYTWFDEMFNTYDYPLLKPGTMLDYIDRFHREHAIVGADRYLWTWVQAHVQIWYTQRYLDPTVKWMPSRYPDGENLRMVAYSALAAGCRGLLWFPSRYFAEEYHGADRLAEAGLLGCELEVIGPWLAEGTVGPELETSAEDLHVWPVDFPGGRLLLAMVIDDRTQYHVGGGVATDRAVILDRPIPEDAEFWELTAGCRPRPPRLWGGGGLNEARDELTLPIFDMTTLVLITDDESVKEQARDRMRAVEADAARFATQALSAKIDKVQPVLDVIRANLPDPDPAGATVAPARSACRSLATQTENARARLAKARDAIEKASYASARRQADDGRRMIRSEVRRAWETLNRDPFVRETNLLPNLYLAELYYPLLQSIVNAEGSENLLANPSFEQTEEGTVVGWQGMAAGHDQTGVRGLVEEARTGEHALRFTSESPTIYQGEERDWVTVNAISDLIEVRQWDGLEATAWVRIDENLQKTERGAVLQIAGYDAEGEGLSSWRVTDVEATRVGVTDGWLELTTRMVVTQADAERAAVRLGICGVGECVFDDVSLIRRRPPAQGEP